MESSPTRIARIEDRLQSKGSSPAFRATARSERDEENWPQEPDDDGDAVPGDDHDDFEIWPPDDLDLELDEEPDPEPGDFWLPDDGEE